MKYEKIIAKVFTYKKQLKYFMVVIEIEISIQKSGISLYL